MGNADSEPWRHHGSGDAALSPGRVARGADDLVTSKSAGSVFVRSVGCFQSDRCKEAGHEQRVDGYYKSAGQHTEESFEGSVWQHPDLHANRMFGWALPSPGVHPGTDSRRRSSTDVSAV